MSLASGTRVGSYEVVAPLGAGGMGEVYRARDAKLHRDVAIKVLPELFALDRDRLARFEREAQVLAALNHPNTAAADGARAQLMAISVEPGPSFSWSKPVPLFDLAPYFTYLTGRAYDPAPDGRFLMVGMAAESAPGAQHRLHIVTNWFAELQTEMRAR